MMKIKKWLPAVCLTVMMALLAGCANEQNPVSEEEEPAGETTAVSSDLVLWYTDDKLTSYLETAAAAYAEENGIQVTTRLVSAVEYLESISEASVSDEGGPDLFIAGAGTLEEVWMAGLAKEQEKIPEGDYPSAALDAVSYKGRAIAWPLCYDTTVLVYNAEHTDRAPATFDEILAFSEEFEGAEGVENIFKWNVSSVFYNYLFAGAYVNLGGDAGDDRELLNVENEQTLQCLAYFQELSEYFAIDQDAVSDELILSEFNEGKTVFILADAQMAGALNPEINYQISQVPALTDQLLSKPLSVTQVLVVNGFSENPTGAEGLAAYLSAQAKEQLYDLTGKLPAASGAENEIAEVFSKQYENSAGQPKLLELTDYFMQLEITYTSIWKGEDPAGKLSELSGFVSGQFTEE